MEAFIATNDEIKSTETSDDVKINDVKEEVLQNCLSRQREIDLLLKYLGGVNEISAPSIFVSGKSSTGKTHVVKNILNRLSLRHSYLSCIEHYSAKLIYQKVLSDARCESKTCSTMVDFCRHLKQSPVFEKPDQNFYIVLDKAERLRNMDAHLLPAFLRLAELTSLNVCTILISELIFEKFFTTTGFFDPAIIYFSDYSKVDLLRIISLDFPADYGQDFYEQYCRILLDVFYGVCKDLNELRYLATLYFPKYCEPLTSGEVQPTDIRKLWLHIAPSLKKALQSVYLREVSSSQWDHMQKTHILNEKGTALVELPYFSKYLLLAAYFASSNPATTDRRFFAKKSAGRMSKRAKTSAKAAKNQDKKFLGPKPFTIDRLMAIFYSIVEGGGSSSANILSQLSTLVTLKLLSKVSADDQIDTPKYKCIVSLDFAQSIAKQINLDVAHYLYDL